jgi:hypothetical protein
MTKGPCKFTLLVPAASHAHRESTMESLGRRLATTPLPEDARGAVEADYDHARKQLEFGIGQLQKLGAEVDGTVGDANPVKAIEDALSRRKYSEIILSTLPSGVFPLARSGPASQGDTQVQGSRHGCHGVESTSRSGQNVPDSIIWLEWS